MRRDTYSRCLSDFLNWMRRCTEEGTSYSTASQKVRPSAYLRECHFAAVQKSQKRNSRPMLRFQPGSSSHMVASEQSHARPATHAAMDVHTR